MKIKRFNTMNVPARDSNATATIRVQEKGYIALSQLACERLEIKAGGGVEFLQDEERPRDWYLVVTEADTAFRVRQTKASSSMIIQSMPIAKNILSSVDPTMTSASFLLAAEAIEIEGEKVWPIITASAKSKQ